MKIKKIESWSADLGNVKPYTIAFKTINEVRNAFVEITLDDGTTGIGAGNPSEYVVGENIDQCMEALQEGNLEFLIGRDIRELNQLTYEVWKNFPENPSARAALDIALHDVFTKHLDIPLVKFLGQKIKRMATSNTIGIKGVKETLDEAEDYVKRGFKVLKVKLGRDLEEDVERLMKLRERFGNGLAIRVDANQGYTPEQTIQFYGRGPVENYQDRNYSAPVGIYTQTVKDQFYPYIRPQETGNKTDIRWFTITSKKGRGLRIEADSSLLSMSALHFYTDDLDDGDKKDQRHSGELKPHAQTQLNIDFKQMGVGSVNSWGAIPLDKYRMPYQNYSYQYKIKPL